MARKRTGDVIQSAPPAGASPAWGVEITGLTKRFDGSGRRGQAGVVAVDNVGLQVKRGDFCVLLGPSGCGKTTLLRCLAGLERPTSARITVNGAVMFDSAQGIDVKAQDRPVGMVFQSYALWPHLNVRRNVAFPLTTSGRRQRLSRASIRARVDEVLGVMQIGNLAERRVSQLSGGQQQRVALARAIAAGNDLVLFDEPLSNIDAKVRERLREELRAMQLQLGFTAVYVTHDQSEAMEMADQIAVMSRGTIAQIGPPRRIYNAPANAEVARFVGSSNMIASTLPPHDVSAAAPFVVLDTSIGEYMLDRSSLTEYRAASSDAGPDVLIVSRTSSWWISGAPPASMSNAWKGDLVSVAYQGTQTEYVVGLGDVEVRISADDQPDLQPGQVVWVGTSPLKGRLVDRD